MLRLVDFLQGKELVEERKLDYKNVFNLFVREWKFGSQYHIESFDECTQLHFDKMD